MFCILPAMARGLYGLAFLIFYNIHGDLKQQMIAELADMRAERMKEQGLTESHNEQA